MECLLISRSQAPVPSLYNDYGNQLANLWESYYFTRSQINQAPTDVAVQALNISAPNVPRYNPPALEYISNFIEELILITSGGKESARVSDSVLILIPTS